MKRNSWEMTDQGYFEGAKRPVTVEPYQISM